MRAIVRARTRSRHLECGDGQGISRIYKSAECIYKPSARLQPDSLLHAVDTMGYAGAVTDNVEHDRNLSAIKPGLPCRPDGEQLKNPLLPASIRHTANDIRAGHSTFSALSRSDSALTRSHLNTGLFRWLTIVDVCWIAQRNHRTVLRHNRFE